jgi:HK97 family phage portal protein
MATIPQRLALAFKAVTSRLGSLVFPGSRYRYGPGPGWSYSSAARTTYGLGSSEAGAYNAIVQAQFRWITDNLPEAEPRVRRRNAKGDLDPVEDHPLLELLRNPNPYYSSLSLFDATYREWRRGNAYWIIVRNAQRQPLQLWWAPSIMMEPIQGDDPRQFIDHYEYHPRSDKDAIWYAPEDVIHFRNGLNPDQPQKGMSDLDCLLRELYTDDEAASWSSTLLAHGAGPHVLISGDDDDGIDAVEAEQIKHNYLQKTTGAQRGEPLVVSGRTKIQVMSFNPQEMDLKLLRRVPEERISAVIGVPAVVCGLGAGLDRSTYNNMREAKEMATENVLIPAWRFFARELQRQLLPQLGDARRDVFDFDLSTVRALQDDQNALWKRLDDALKSGGITLNESREGRGLDTLGAAGDVYYLPVALTPTPVAALVPPVPPVPVGERSEALPPPGGASADAEEEPVAPETRGEALPAVFEAKADSNYVTATHRLRERLQGPFLARLEHYFSMQQMRVLARLSQDFKGYPPFGHKDYGEEVLDWNEEQRELQAIFDTAYRQMLDGTQELASASLGVSFELDDPATRAYLASAGDHIVGITETTQQAIQQALMAGQALGENLDQLTARLQSLGAFSESRARMIARTELGVASNLSSLASFEASGVVVGVRIYDGTDHEPCAGLNGRTLSLEAAAALPPLSHPNCTRALAPLTRPAQLTGGKTNGHVRVAA